MARADKTDLQIEFPGQAQSLSQEGHGQKTKEENTLKTSEMFPATRSGLNLDQPTHPGSSKEPIKENLKLSSAGRTQGSKDLGKCYEAHTAALYALNFGLKRYISDFSMTTNRKEDGLFDDIKIELTDNNKKRMYFFQLKYQPDKSHIPKGRLTNERFKNKENKLYLKTYLDYASKQNTNDEKKFILYTNSRVLLEQGDSLEFGKEKEKFLVKECENLKDQDVLLNHQTKVFQFESNETGKVQENFYFFTEQSDIEKIEIDVKEKLKPLLGERYIFDSYMNFMENWRNDDFIITKEFLLKKIMELALSPYVRTFCGTSISDTTDLLKEAIMDFEMTIIDEKQESIVRRFWNKSEKYKNLEESLLYKFDADQKVSDVQKSVILWDLGKVPLIVKVDDVNRKMIEKLMKLFHKYLRDKAVVLVGTVDSGDFPGWKIFENLFDLTTYGKKHYYQKILNNFHVSLQGRKKIPLQKLVEIDKELVKLFGTKELLKISQNSLFIGQNKEQLPELHFTRTVPVNLIPMEEVVRFFKNTNVLLIISCDNNSFKEEITRSFNFQTVELNEYLNKRSTEKVDKLILFSVNKILTNRNFDEVLKLSQMSKGCVVHAVNKEKCVLILKNFKFDFMMDEENIHENELHDYFKRSLKVFCAPPGMGKSRMMDVLSHRCPPERWAVDVKLINHNSFLKLKPNFEEIWSRFLDLNYEGYEITNRFKNTLRKNKNVEVFLDGLDELDSEHLEVMLDFIKHLSSDGISVWVSSRDNLRSLIQKTMNVQPLEIQQLDREKQKMYIEKKLQKPEKMKISYTLEQIDKIIKTVFQSVDVVNSQELLGIPLQLHILTEIFLTNREAYDKLEKENIFVITKMYNLFFEGKYYYTLEKERLSYEKADKLGIDFDYRLKKYSLVGLNSSLNREDLIKLSINDEKWKTFLKKLEKGDIYGIVTNINVNTAVFDHQTFAEYFACLYFKENKNKFVLLINDIFFEHYENLLKIFNIILAEENPLHLAIIYKNLKEFEKNLKDVEKTDKFGRTALHLACCSGTQNDFIDEYDRKRLERNLKFKRESEVNIEIIRRLLENTTEIDKRDELLNFNCIEYALKSRCIYPIEEMIKQKKLNDFSTMCNTFSFDYQIKYLLHLATQCGYSNLFKTFTENYPECINNNRKKEELLEMAIFGCQNDQYLKPRKGNIEIVKMLIESGVRLNLNNGYLFHKKYLLERVCENGIYDMIEVLLNHGGVCSNGNTVLHLLAIHERKINEVMKKMIRDFSIDVNGRNDEGATALHYACQNGNNENVKTLLDIGAKTDIVDNCGNDPLRYASTSASITQIISDFRRNKLTGF